MPKLSGIIAIMKNACYFTTGCFFVGLALFLSACTTLNSLEPKNFKLPFHSDKGEVAFSAEVSGAAARIAAQHGMEFYYYKVNANGSLTAKQTLQLQANTAPYYNVYVLKLHPGHYVIDGCAYYLPTLNQLFAGNQYNYTCPVGQSLQFTIQPGKVIYIGGINYQINDRRGVLAYSNNPKVQITVKNQSQRDLAAIAQQWPDVPLKHVQVKLAQKAV